MRFGRRRTSGGSFSRTIYRRRKRIRERNARAVAVYPSKDIDREAQGRLAPRARKKEAPRALIESVLPESPADDAGFEPGCYLTSVDGEPIRDLIDWRWLSADDEITVGYIELGTATKGRTGASSSTASSSTA